MRDDVTADMAALVPELLVSDFGQSLDFYRLLGFDVLYGRPEDGFAYLDRNGAQLMIEERDPASRREWIAAPLEAPFGRGVNFQVDVDDVEALHRRCRSAGVPVFLDIETKWYRRDRTLLGVRQFIVTDPDGYLIRLSQHIGTRLAGDRP